jgi:Cu+-exporting ATPase
MAVDPDDAAGTLRHEGVRYYFCSLDCAHSFAKHPDRYTARAADNTGDAR